MKVGTDGVLLGAWCALRGDDSNVLDIGSGTGLLSLMLAQRSGAYITGVEIDEGGYLDSCENVDASPWRERITIINSAIQEYAPRLRYELIVSNPPFFRNSLKSPDASRSVARHTDSLPFSDLIDAVARLLSPDGRFAVVLPVEQARSFDIEACGVLYLSRRCAVVTHQGKAAKRYLSEYRLEPSEHITHETLTMREEEGWSDEYISLTAQFYQDF